MAILSFKNNPIQRAAVFSPYRNTAYVGAIRSGKTVGFSARMLMIADKYPNGRILIGRKTFVSLFDTTWREFCAIVTKRNGAPWTKPGVYVKHWDGQFYNLELRNGTIFHARYIEEIERLLSLELSAYWIDQAEEMEEDQFNHLDSRLSYWNAERRQEFFDKYGYWPKHFANLTANPDPGFLRTLLFENPKTKGEWKIYETDIEQNRKNLGPNYIEKLYQTRPKDWCDRFLKGSWDIRQEQVYKEFNEDIHCIEPFKIPDHWLRFISLDWGINEYHRCAVLWCAVDERGVIYVYQELSVTDMLASAVAEEIKKRSQNIPVQRSEDGGILVYMDPSTDRRGGIVERTIFGEFQIHKIYGIKANNDVDAGINKVQEVLHLDPETGKPRLFFFRGLTPWTVRSLKLYKWKPPDSNGVGGEKPMKKDDDEADSLRYLIMAVLEDRPSPLPKVVHNIRGEVVEKINAPDLTPSYDAYMKEFMMQVPVGVEER